MQGVASVATVVAALSFFQASLTSPHRVRVGVRVDTINPHRLLAAC